MSVVNEEWISDPEAELFDRETLSPFVLLAGCRPTHVSPERVEAVIDLGDQHHTPWGVVHGGVFTSAVETVASLGASAAVASLGMAAVGVNNNTDLLRPMTAGRVRVVGTPVHQGRRQQLWKVTLRRESDMELVALAHLRLENVALT